MSDDHVGVKINGVIYVKLEDVKPLRKAFDAAQARIERLEGALRFYAEPDKYTDCHGADVQIPDFYSELDFGETARVALNATR